MIDEGQGPPIILIPGIQGRWEWMQPTVRALSKKHRVLTFSLGSTGAKGDGSVFHKKQGSGARGPDPDSAFDAWVDYIDSLYEQAGIASATVIGISFGGLIAAYYASRRPDRVAALVLVSAPSPTFEPNARVSGYMKHPRLSLPFFAVNALSNLWREIACALPSWSARIRFILTHLVRTVRYPLSVTAMTSWVRDWKATDVAADFSRIHAPTLIITGETDLDRVVPVASTLEYLHLIPGSRLARMPRTGHIGCVSRPDEFAQICDTVKDAPVCL